MQIINIAIPAANTNTMWGVNLLSPSVKTRCGASVRFHDQARAFVSNFQEIAQLEIFPFRLVGVGRQYQMAYDKAREMLGIARGDDTEVGEKNLVNEMFKIISKIMNNELEGYQKLPIAGHNIYVDHDPSIKDYWNNLMKAAVLGIWTAYEALAGDLWEAAVNLSPGQLSSLKGKAKGSNRASTETQADNPEYFETKDEKSIPIHVVRKYGFNLEGKMGTVLRSTTRYNFSKRDDIIRAYLEAFYKDQEKIKTIVSDQDLRILNVVRNLMVHRAGIIDEEFIKKIGTYLGLGPLKIGDPFRLNGSLTNMLVKAGTEASVSLIEAVDAWLDAHPKSSLRE